MEECCNRETSWACWGAAPRPAPKVSALQHLWVARNPKSPLWRRLWSRVETRLLRRLPIHGDHVVRALSYAVHREAIATHSDSFADRGVARTAPISLLATGSHTCRRGGNTKQSCAAGGYSHECGIPQPHCASHASCGRHRCSLGDSIPLTLTVPLPVKMTFDGRFRAFSLRFAPFRARGGGQGPIRA